MEQLGKYLPSPVTFIWNKYFAEFYSLRFIVRALIPPNKYLRSSLDTIKTEDSGNIYGLGKKDFSLSV